MVVAWRSDGVLGGPVHLRMAVPVRALFGMPRAIVRWRHRFRREMPRRRVGSEAHAGGGLSERTRPLTPVLVTRRVHNPLGRHMKGR